MLLKEPHDESLLPVNLLGDCCCLAALLHHLKVDRLKPCGKAPLEIEGAVQVLEVGYGFSRDSEFLWVSTSFAVWTGERGRRRSCHNRMSGKGSSRQ